MRVLVTGAAGFIGSALSAVLGSAGHDVFGIDNFSDYYSVNLKESRVKHFYKASNVKFQNLDFSDRNAIASIIREFGPDAVVHLGAQPGVRLPLDQFWRYTSSNLTGFSILLETCINQGVKNFIYASSSSVYGDNSPIPYNENSETLNPGSFYGATKLFNEIAIPTLVKNSRTRARGLRFFTVYGPWGRPDMAYFRMLANVLSGSKFEFFGDGTVERDFTYIDDACKIVLQLMTELNAHESGYFDVVNVGGGRPLSMNYLVDLVEELSGKKISFVRAPAKIEDVKKTMADPAYLLTLIHQKPETRLDVGLQATMEWFQEIPSNIIFNWAESSI